MYYVIFMVPLPKWFSLQFEFQGVKMVKVACGWRHTISVSSSGGLYTYGWSKYGQLGHGDFEDHLTPHKLESLKENLISEVLFLLIF